MNIFEKWNNTINTESIKEGINNANKNNTKEFVEVPHGVYEVKIDSMQLKESKSGSPMVSIWFKIVEGEFKNQMIFMNQIVMQGFQVHIVNEFLRSLDTGLEIEFDNYIQYNELLLDILEEVDGKLEFALEYGEKNGFNTFKIKEVFDI